MLEELIDNLENDEDVVLLHPVSSQSLSAAQAFLLKKGITRLPDDYIEFLHLSNGISYKNMSFYGTNAVEEERMPDLVSANDKFFSHYNSKHLVLLGSDKHNYFVYNEEINMYEIIEKEDLEQVEEFEEFEDILSEFFENDSSFLREDDDDYGFEDDYED